MADHPGLFESLDPFRDNKHLELMSYADQRLGQDLIVGGRIDRSDEMFVDLSQIKKEIFEVPERDEPRPKIIKGKGDPTRLQLFHKADDDIRQQHRRLFRNLKDQTITDIPKPDATL